MAEINLILTSPGRRSRVTSIAVAETGAGIASISQKSLKELAHVRDLIIGMMVNGATRMSSNQLRIFGQTIGRVLFDKDVADTWKGADAALRAVAKNGGTATPAPLITRLWATSPELKAIPWEYAAWPSGQDGPLLRNSVVRLVPQSQVDPSPALAKGTGLRVLLLRANPAGPVNPIPWAQLSGTLKSTFGQLGIPVVWDADAPGSNTYVRIVEATQISAVRTWVRTDDPHIIHFIGHGTSAGLSFIDSASREVYPVSPAALEQALHNSKSLRLLILSACDTANHTTVPLVDASIGTFAEQIVRNAVPAVIASQMAIDQTTIAWFCEALYAELLSSGSIDVAVAAGRCRIMEGVDKPHSAGIEWGIPVLYRRLGAAQLFV